MKKFFTRLTKILLLIFFPGFLIAQELKDYTLLLNSGKFVPEQNIGSISKSADVFQKSLFNGKHYVTIQFTTLPNEAAKQQLKSVGIELLDYIPNMAYTASVNTDLDIAGLRNFSIRSVLQFNLVQKTVPDILIKKVPPHAVKSDGYADVSILLYEYLTVDKIINSINALGASVIADMPVFRTYTIRIKPDQLRNLVELPFVQWAEFIDPPTNHPENLPGRTLHRVNVLNDGVRNLKGDGINIGVWDQIVSQHLDFLPAGRLINIDPGAPGFHGTHVSGTIGGRGLINPFARGMAPNATIYSYSNGGDVQSTMAVQIPANTLVVSNHSYHDLLGVQCGLTGASASYSLRARNTDINLNNNLYHLHCHSSGNNQAACAGGWGTITGTGKAAKNNVAVGSISSLEAISSFSSFGPVHDGRIKPEISAMGQGVFSTYTPLNTYATENGTSMATPGVAGTLALLVQRYKQLNANVLPPSALIKNIACNTAADLGNVGPDYRFGFGRINALAAVRVLEQNRYVLNNSVTGSTNDVTVFIPPGSARLRVMLTWNDPAAAANAAFALVNNLNLSVINGATTTLPWILDPDIPTTPATKGVDNYSNIEQVTVDNPPTGIYTLRVEGASIPTGPTQVYALSWNIEQPYIEVIYPNGGESFSPNGTQVLTWDNAGITGNQTVEYSLNNGTSWTTISSTIPSTTTRLTWSVPPGANTSTALIRVTSGAISDISDATFKILGTPTVFTTGNISCDPGEINFTWSAVPDATHYDIYRLDSTIGQFVILSSNITGTTFIATGLPPGASMWFALVAKNNNTGAVSERSIAINRSVSSGGGGMGTIGAITGQTTICGTPSNVPYSISAVTGATTYLWTAPPGAVIASGQGTSAITIDFPAGSTNGNITVSASNGICQTPASILSISVFGTLPTTPTTGGNQSQTICAGAVVPTLTASVIVPSGHSVIWYNAATGGAVVTPTLSTVGTVTYFASSRNIITGCESQARTPVVLTIISIPAATATAGGTTTFCQGGNVVLTAGSGTSYVWRRDGTPISGATSQTYTATTSGSYTVTVTTAPCTSTSAPIVVTVNPLPVATIIANGATSFCQGGSVILTASAGSSWLWSTGATTQSITVSTTGNYSVTVTNASGCVATSSVTAVAVSPSPVVTITASPYTKLFPGLSTTLSANVSPPGSYSYTWFKNGVAVSGATTSTLTGIDLDDLGSYTVSVTNTTGLPCSNTSAALAISDSATTKLFIYPSPNSGQFKVVHYTIGTNVKNTLTIYDSKGAHVFTGSYTISSPYQTMNVDLRRHGRGIYRVVLFDKAGQKVADGAVVIQ